MKNPFLIGKKIYLRPLEAADAEGNYPLWLNDHAVCEHNSHGLFPYTRDAARGYIAQSANDATKIILAIVDISSDRHIGNAALQSISMHHRSAELAILIGERDFFGKGIGKEACSLLMAHGFKALGLHRIHCGTSGSNVAMQKLAESLKMTREGCRREAFFKNGTFEDIIEYGIVKDEYYD